MMIFPVKIFNRRGELTRIITAKQLIERMETKNANQKPTNRERFKLMVNTKKQAPGQES